MTLAASSVILLTAVLGVATQTLPLVDPWAENKTLWLGVAIVTVVTVSRLLGHQPARSKPAMA